MTIEEIEKFLISYKEEMDAETVISILNNHNKLGDCISWLQEIDRYDKIVFHYIRI